MRYRWNKYMTVKQDNDQLIMFNPFNYEMIKCSLSIKEIIDQELESASLESLSVNAKKLFEKGLIVGEDYCEEQVVEELYIQQNHNADVLDLLIFLTLDCNFACKYCFEKHEIEYIDEKTQAAIIRFVKKKIKSYGSLQVSWFGGEPLLAVSIIEKMTEEFKTICKENKKSYIANMTTNGSLLNYDCYLRMKKCNIFAYQITIDGTRDYHDCCRYFKNGKGSFDIIINNLLEIHKKDKSRFVSFIIRTNLTKNNVDDAESFFEYFDELFENDTRFSHRPQVAWAGNDNDEDRYFTTEELGIYANISKFLTREFRGIENDDEKVAKAKLEMVKLRMQPCKSGKRNHLGIMPDGILHMCEPHYDEPCSQVGYLKEDGFVVLNDRYIKWVTGAKEWKRECRDCRALPICLSAECPYRMSLKKDESGCKGAIESIDKIISIFSKNLGTCPELTK